MKMTKVIIFLVLIFIFSACDNSNKDVEYLNGEIRYINKDSVKSKDVISESIPIENRGYGMFSVYDSLIIFWNIKFPNHFFSIYNVDTENEVGFFCNKGRGYHEFSSVAPIFQIFKIGNDLKTTIRDANNQKIYFWNISQSISEKTTIYDTVISYNNLGLNKNSVMDNLFYQSGDIFLTRISSIYFIEGDTPLPYYKKWHLSDGVMNDYHVYKKIEINDDSDYSLQDRVYSVDAIKPDGSKVVQALGLVPQINIIDIETGKITSHRIVDVSQVSLFNSRKDDGRVYYNSVQADNNYIYATYWGDKQWDTSLGSECPFINIIHVFNWEGQMLYELKTDRVFFRISLDPVRNRLYTSNLDTDEMYYIDLNELWNIK